MANKPTYTTIPTNSQYTASVLNGNFEKMAVAIQGCLGLSGINEAGNVSTGIWDLNNFRLQNIADPVNDGDAINKGYADTNLGGASVTAAANSATDAANSASAALTSEGNASSSAASASTSASNAAVSEATCASYSNIGFDTAGAYDFGVITDTVLLFPTDFGLIV